MKKKGLTKRSCVVSQHVKTDVEAVASRFCFALYGESCLSMELALQIAFSENVFDIWLAS